MTSDETQFWEQPRIDCRDCDLTEEMNAKLTKSLTESRKENEELRELLEMAKKEMALMCGYFQNDLQVILHRNDVVPSFRGWLSDYDKLKAGKE